MRMAQFHRFNRSRFEASVDTFEIDRTCSAKSVDESCLFDFKSRAILGPKSAAKIATITNPLRITHIFIRILIIAHKPKAAIRLNQAALEYENMSPVVKMANTIP
jgi:hypothetical protein